MGRIMEKILYQSRYKKRKSMSGSSISLERTAKNSIKYDIVVNLSENGESGDTTFHLLQLGFVHTKTQYRRGARYNEILELYNAISNEDDVFLISGHLPPSARTRVKKNPGELEKLSQEIEKFRKIGQKYFDFK